MHLPAHPLWFLLILLSPFLSWAVLWAMAPYGRASLKALTPWLITVTFLSLPALFPLEASGNDKILCVVGQAIFYSCLFGTTLIKRRSVYETLRSPSRWYLPWGEASFSILQNARTCVRDMNAVAPWYVEKLGFHEVPNLVREAGTQTYRFSEDGRSIVLATKTIVELERRLVLFTKKMARMRRILAERGIEVGPIERDRQGTRYFEIHDPEGNAIEVVEES